MRAEPKGHGRMRGLFDEIKQGKFRLGRVKMERIGWKNMRSSCNVTNLNATEELAVPKSSSPHFVPVAHYLKTILTPFESPCPCGIK